MTALHALSVAATEKLMAVGSHGLFSVFGGGGLKSRIGTNGLGPTTPAWMMCLASIHPRGSATHHRNANASNAARESGMSARKCAADLALDGCPH